MKINRKGTKQMREVTVEGELNRLIEQNQRLEAQNEDLQLELQ
jgi:uncharacterized protein (UPF0335 family)